MDKEPDRAAQAVPATLDQEMRLINEAIALVASGAAPRTTVAGLRLGDALLDAAQRVASDAGVRIVPLWRDDEAGVDLAVERIAP